MAAKEKKMTHAEKVSAMMIERLKEGTAPFQKPWKPGFSNSAHNPTTEKPYRGINQIWLSMMGRSDPRWLTYKQAKEIGAQVRKNEKSTCIEYWKFEETKIKKDKNGNVIKDADGKPEKITYELQRPKVFYAYVFNAEQIDNMPPLPSNKPTWDASETVKKAEAILANSGAKIFHDQDDRAFFNNATDEIHLPPKSNFNSDIEYFTTAMHELGHWTGHPSRLNRDLSHPFGSAGYAKEELRAEISSVMVAEKLGLGHDPNNHVAYVGSWIKALEDDPREIFRAAADAEKIVEYVLGLEHNLEVEKTSSSLSAVEPAVSSSSPAPAGESTHAVNESAMPSEKYYLNVPFAEKNDAKKLGARWDATAKSWYINSEADKTPFSKWDKPREAENRTVEEQFKDALTEFGLVVENPIMDGNLHRAPVADDRPGQTSGSYVGHLDGRPAGFFENFKAGTRANWKADSPPLSAAEKAKISKEAEAKKLARLEARESAYAEVAVASSKAFDSYLPAPADHPYLVKKNIQPHDAKVDEKGHLVLPIRAVDDSIRSLQRIAPNGFRGMESNGQLSGNFQVVGGSVEEALAGDDVLIAESFGTAASLNEALGVPVVNAFSGNNLLAAGQSIKSSSPSAQLVFCADDDAHRLLENKSNSGLVNANKAAESLDGLVVAPLFSPDRVGSKEFTDWNDVHRVDGLDAVADQFKAELSVKRSVRDETLLAKDKSVAKTVPVLAKAKSLHKEQGR